MEGINKMSETLIGELLTNDMKIARIIGIVKQLAKGELLELPDGNKIGMTEDMSIGYIIKTSNESEGISSLCTMDLKQLFSIVDKNDLWYTLMSRE
jgi:hypothetical protein